MHVHEQATRAVARPPFVRSASSSSRLLGALLVASALAGCGPVDPALEDVSPDGGAVDGLFMNGVRFETVLGGRFVGAQNNGGGAVNATATVAQAWETFDVDDINGGALVSGDTVFIRAGNGQYFQAVNGGGSTLHAGSANRLGWETFRIVKDGGSGAIANGDVVGLQATNGTWISAQNGGGGPVFVYGAALGPWERLRISGLPSAPPPPPPPTNPVTVTNVTLRTLLMPTYLRAASNGGGAIDATATAAQGWETFSLIDVNGGSLASGDSVQIRTGGGQFFRAVNGALDATATTAGTSETFRIVRRTGTGTITSGTEIALVAQSGQYVTATNGGGSTVASNGAALDTWEVLVFGIGPTTPPPPPPSSTRVIGYLPNWYGSYASWATRVDFSRLTHVNLAFALGDSNGNLELAPRADIEAFVRAAHAQGVKVFPSLCGGGGDGRITPFYQPSRVDAFVDNIINFTVSHGFDGIDVDVEAPDRMGALYDTFIAKLIAKARPRGLPVTAAVAQWMQYGMSDTTLRSFDFITIMSYDNTGTWTGPGEHSSYAQAQAALNFYASKGVARDRMVLGVPFYGYCWGNCSGRGNSYVLYKDILSMFPNAASQDFINANGSQYSYNGLATMRAKTDLGETYGGIMIWELAGDVATTSDQSLLRAIDGALP